MAFLKRLGPAILALLCLTLAALGQSSEYKLEAAYLCRLVDFVEWPTNSFSSPDSPLVIGVLGRDPFGKALEEVATGQVSKGHPLKVRHFNSASEINDCKELFICASETPRLNAILQQLEGRAMLTVSDAPNFTAHGGIVWFYTEANKVRFRINLDAANVGKLAISSRLLQLADVVKDGKAAP
jgi:hypothetical protein